MLCPRRHVKTRLEGSRRQWGASGLRVLAALVVGRWGVSSCRELSTREGVGVGSWAGEAWKLRAGRAEFTQSRRVGKQGGRNGPW